MSISIHSFKCLGTQCSASKFISISPPESITYTIYHSHDYHQNPQAQIDFYMNKRDNRWTMPDHTYNIYRSLSNSAGGATLEIIFIDTPILCPSETEETAPGGIHAVTEAAYTAAYQQLVTLLAQSTATWLFVAGHYTIYSMAEHGDNVFLIETLVPLFKKYGVQAYFNGHDHVLQAIEWEGVHYITSGNGAWPPEGYFPAEVSSAAEGNLFKSLAPGFTAVQVQAAAIKYEMIDMKGNTIFTHTLTNPRPAAVTHKQPTIDVGALLGYVLPALGIFFAFSCAIVAATGLRMYYLVNVNTQVQAPGDYIAVNPMVSEDAGEDEDIFHTVVGHYAEDMVEDIETGDIENDIADHDDSETDES